MMLELYILMAFLIVGALVAVAVRGLLSSVVAVGAVGMGLCVMFLFLKAPDLAITQLVVEILCLVILLKATIQRGVARELHRPSIWIFGGFLLFSAVFLAGAFVAIKELPEFGKPLMTIADYYIQNTLPKVKAANIVAAIILDFRGYDTLGEATVLFTAVIGTLAVMRRKGRKKIDEADLRDEPDR